LVIEAYRLHCRRYTANSGKGAAIRGGRWNRAGQEAIYTAATRSLAALEILAHYDVLPRGFLATPVRIPEELILALVVEPAEISIGALRFPNAPGWMWHIDPVTTGTIGGRWIDDSLSAVLSVPSAIVPVERNYILNPDHPQFVEIEFLPSDPFAFDPRLK
jgi:RES domain-containing protein